MRIISGELRGKRLFSASGERVRPTTDRHRETIFNILSGGVAGANVLDLFAGTGAMGIEALSRGAASAVFVDNYKPALEAVHRNLRSCRLESKSRVIRWDIAKNLHPLKTCSFDLVFLDPPYDLGLVSRTLENLLSCSCTRTDTRIVAEHSKSEPVEEKLPALALIDRRQFGKTLVSFFKCMI